MTAAHLRSRAYEAAQTALAAEIKDLDLVSRGAQRINEALAETASFHGVDQLWRIANDAPFRAGWVVGISLRTNASASRVPGFVLDAAVQAAARVLAEEG